MKNKTKIFIILFFFLFSSLVFGKGLGKIELKNGFSGYGGNCLVSNFPNFSNSSSLTYFFKNGNNEGFLVANVFSEEDNSEIDALILIGKEKFFVEDGNRKIKLKEGNYNVKIFSDEMTPVEDNIKIVKDSTVVKIFQLKPVSKKVEIKGKILDFENNSPISFYFDAKNCKNYYECDYDSISGIFKIKGFVGLCTLEIYPYGDYMPLKREIKLSEDCDTFPSIFVLKDNITKSFNTLFLKNGSILDKSSFTELDKIVNILNDYPTLKIKIYSFTDDSGKAEDNLKLSEKRCETVREYLLERGIEQERISIKGFGETMNLFDNETKENRLKNRRLEITFYR
ncbi:MAG: OmpA family protein [candidate division WOR-3 bacterium]